MKPVYLHFFLFAALFCLGLAIGVLFDVYRVCRAVLRPGKRWTQVGDFLFWVFVTIFVLAFLFLGNWGDFRAFVLLALAMGLTIYFPMASHLVIRVLIFLVNILWQLFRFIKRLGKLLVRVLLILGFPIRVAVKVKRMVSKKIYAIIQRVKLVLKRSIKNKIANLKAKFVPPDRKE